MHALERNAGIPETPNGPGEHVTAVPPRLPPSNAVKGQPVSRGFLLDVLGPILLHALLLVALVIFARFIIPRFVEVLAGLGAPLPLFTRFVLGLYYSLSHYWLLVMWLGLGLDSLLCLAFFWIGGRKACRTYGIIVAAMLMLLAVAGVVALLTAMPGNASTR